MTHRVEQDRQSAAALPRLALTGADLDRTAALRAVPDIIERLLAAPSTAVVELRGGRVPVRRSDDGSQAILRRAPEAADAERLAIVMGDDPTTGTPCVVVVCAEPPPGPDGTPAACRPDDPHAGGQAEWLGLRQSGGALSAADADLCATALGMANWHEAQQFCPRCGHATEPALGGWIRRCLADGVEHYPRTDPAVIVAVTDDTDRMLFGRGIAWPEGQFSMLAGFVEPGESFETAAAREVHEESGVTIADVRYLGSQPWPFPASIMVAMSARAVTTATRPAPGEMAEVLWLSREEYSERLRSGSIRVPGGISVARRMITRWLGADPADVAGDARLMPWQVVAQSNPVAATTD